LINSNFDKTRHLLEKILINKKVSIVINENADISKLPFKPHNIFRVSLENCFDSYDNLVDCYKLIQEGDIVLFLCGPLGRVLAYEWYKNKNTITCLELGSFYDYLTMSKAYLYHTDMLPLCSVCNPSTRDEEIDCTGCSYVERLYHDIYYLENIYKVPSKVKKVTKYLSKNPESREHQYVYEWLYNRKRFETENLNEQQLKEICFYFLENYPHRAEAVFEFSKNITDKLQKIKILDKISDIVCPTEGYHINKSLYEWVLLDELVIDCYYSGLYHESYKYWQQLMSRDSFPNDYVRDRCRDNGRYAKMIIDDEKSFELFKKDIDNIEYPRDDNNKIPKIFHFIYIHGCHPFTMSHYISIKSCWEVQKPDKIYLYCDREDNENKWLEKVREIADIKIVTIPSYINDQNIPYAQHKADLMRLYILYKAGGVYMDIDILSLNPLDGSRVKPIIDTTTLTSNEINK
jgi:hypothetical protein